MSPSPVADFDRAYDNSAAVPGSEAFAPRWTREAEAFRQRLGARGKADLGVAYGPHERQRLDLFRPEAEAEGLVVFVHGGYWKALDRTYWSHLSRGCLERGFAVAVPSYRLAPDVRLTAIAEDVAAAVAAAARLVPAGPLRLAGHSAGGHLVARMVAAGSPIDPALLARIDRVVPVSGLHDLRPIRRTRMNDTLRIDAAEALGQSPALLEPAWQGSIHAVVGAAELPELRRQTGFLVSAWAGLGARIEGTEIPARHHFDVVEDLADPASALTRLLTLAAPL
ncbi:alpha/beta hydrolase [Aureimonas jatrophae]|uniref:Acetyl esterase/lipase n=1 Tax=Aureimonas jatrophae TaxID=1166073 RepID=A0A1H0HP60_9HYPH|nr:alpha/beta hydrolase [Aureimonas jatrophae]MBB3950697.1 acetyl esterase/lipase [Aureimonas jatrophae]SDO20965.1 Acetyl esterase/lipase [Aureimonas jatrophae]